VARAGDDAGLEGPLRSRTMWPEPATMRALKAR
jgi:hypothetical protein